MKYIDKERAILEAVQGKRVLHIGCVGFSDLDDAERVRQARATLHWALSQAADVVGVDYSRAVIERYRELGIFSNVIVGDAEKLEDLPLNERFDYIVAADIIEHLANPGLMLAGLKRFCRPDTKIILTTPNTLGLPNFLRYVFGRFKEGAEHVLGFNTQTLSHILERYKYGVLELNTCYQPNARRPGLSFLVGLCLLRLFPQFGGTLYVVAADKERRDDIRRSSR